MLRRNHFDSRRIVRCYSENRLLSIFPLQEQLTCKGIVILEDPRQHWKID